MREKYSLIQEDSFKRDYLLIDQIRRAGVSVMSNIAKDMEYISENNYAALDDKCDQILRMLENLKKFIKEK